MKPKLYSRLEIIDDVVWPYVYWIRKRFYLLKLILIYPFAAHALRHTPFHELRTIQRNALTRFRGSELYKDPPGSMIGPRYRRD